MRKPTTRLFALVLCVLLLVSQLGLADSVAAETEDPAEPVQTSEQFEPAEEPVTDPVEESVEESVEEPVEAPEAEPVEEPEPEITEAPEPEITEAPEPEITEAPEPEVTEVPVAEVTEAPEVEATEVPEVEATEVPEVEPTEVPEAEATEEPEPVVSLMSASALEPIVLDEDVPMPAAADVTLSVTTDPTPVVAGQKLNSITLTVTAGGVTFADPTSGTSNFSIRGAGLEDVTPDGASVESTGVKLTFNDCTPTAAGDITVTVQKEAFTEEAQPDAAVEATITVNAAPDPEVSASGSLKAGVEGKITLTIGEGSNNSFKSTEPSDYTLSGGLTASKVETSEKTATLTVTPKAAGSITVTVAKAAFTYEPTSETIQAQGTVSVSAADDPAVTASGTLTAGVAGGTIELTITGGNTFANQDAGNFTLVCETDTLSVSSVETSGATATLHVKEAPTKAGSVTVKIKKEAFTYQPESADIIATGSATINAATVDVSVTESNLIAGVARGSITIKSTGINFASNVSANMFSFDPEVEGLGISGELTGDSDSVTLTVTGTPQTPNEKLTVKIKPEAFTYQPASAAEVSVTVAAPTGSIKAELNEGTGGPLYAGTAVNGQTVKLTITGGQGLTFKDGLGNDAFTLGNGLSATARKDTDTQVTLNLSGTPTTAGDVTITADKDQAFTIAPDENKTANITVEPAPTVSAISAAPDTLTAGVSVDTITLTATGGTFAASPDNSLFTLSSVDGLTVTNVTGGSTQATLTVSGAPKAKGTLKITVDPKAFYPVAATSVPTVSITVNAPSGDLEAALVNGPLYAGTAVTNQTITVSIKAEGNDGLKFKDEFTDASAFSLSTTNGSLKIQSVSYNSESQVTLTLSGTPTTAGTFQVKATTDAFVTAPDNDITATGDIEVTEVSGTVTAALEGGDLTAGTVVSGQKITLTATGNLTFKSGSFNTTEDFTLGAGSEGLSIKSAAIGDTNKTVTLTLSGTPEKGGSFTVTVKTSAFAVTPTDGKDRPAGTITVNYPNITLKAKADPPLIEDEDVSDHTITLTATDGVFIKTSETGNFSVSGVAGVSGVASVNADGTTATLTLSGKPTATGTLTITVLPGAFQYQPEQAVTATVNVAQPSGAITAALVGNLLYAGTPVDGQTITVTIDKDNSHGLEFNTGLSPDAFTLSGDGADGLAIENVTGSGDTVTLKLKDTPTTAGDITVTAETSAFKFAPAAGIAATNAITVDPAPTVTLDTNPASIVAGIEKEITIQLTSENENVKFVNAPEPTWFELSDSSLAVREVKVGSDSKSVTLTLSAAPSKDGVLTVTVDPQAFNIWPVSDLTATITIYALYGKVSATLTGTLTAGTEVTTQTITLEITETNGLTFKDGVEANAFTLGEGSADLTITGVTRSDDGLSVTLTLSGTPKAAGTFTVTALRDSAFTVPPTAAGDVTATGDISIGYPTISVTAAPYEDIYEGVDIANNTITVTANGGVFNADTLDGNITIGGTEGLTLESAAKDDDNTVILVLSGTPTSTDDLTITIQPGAFTYQPEKELTATIQVLSPTGKVTAKLNGDPLYAGTPVNGQTVTLTIEESSHGLKFWPQEELDVNEFLLKGNAAAGLTIDAVTWVNDTEVTLTLGGTPTTAGDFEVDAEDSAFTYSPGMEEPAGTFTVNPAPEITLTADPASVTAGLELGTVTVTAENGTFLAQLGTDLFAISSPDGIAEGMEITGVTVVDGTTVTLTVTGAPAKDGTLIVTVDRTAFVIRPETSPEAKIAVAKLTGSVSMALAGGELTAGTAADGLTLELVAAGEGLTFGADAAPGDFLLTGPGAEGLTVSGVTRTDETHVTLTLSGTPAKAGELGVTVKTTAFAVPPTDGQDVTAAPSVTVAYPTVTVTADPASVSEGVAVGTITLTATGGVFNPETIWGDDNVFLDSHSTELHLESVVMGESDDTIVLTVTGAPASTDDLIIVVNRDAFKYQPEKAITVTVAVTGPTGTVAAVLSDALYAYTPVAGQTITVTISDSKGLSFKDGLTPDSFQLTGTAAKGLTVSGVTGSGTSVTLTLSGTPAAGSFTVTALRDAFTFDPGKDMDAGTMSVNPAPEVSVTAEPETLTAGEDVGTITITAVGGTFAPTADASLFALSGYGASGLTIGAVTVNGSTATLTITGAPENVGTLTVTVSRAAFSPVAADDPTVEITVRAGSISTDVETGEGAPAASFGSTVDELADAVLDPEEQAQLAEGATVTITLQEEDISASVSAADKAAVEAAAGDYTIGEYLDVSLFKSINDKQSPVHETSKPIIIVFSVPTNLQGANRQFAVVRVHDGTGTMLNDLDSNPNTITIATDLFSTYAIVYRDAPDPTPSDAPTPAPTEKPAPATTAPSAPTAPNTGDEAAPALWLGLLVLCAGALVLAGGLLRRRSGTR